MAFTEKQTLFRGAAAALVTPFYKVEKDQTAIDYEALGELIERQIAGGCSAVVIGGTTGESATLSENEKRDLFSFAVQAVKGRSLVICGCGSPDTQAALRLCRAAQQAGADAALVVTPFYNKASEEGLFRHYKTLADGSSLPLIVYHVPGRTGLTLSPSALRRLLEIPSVLGVKEAGDQFSLTLSLFSESCRAASLGKPVGFYSGNDDRTLPLLALGADGVISVTANLLPKTVAALCQRMFVGDLVGARALHQRLEPLNSALFSLVNPIPVKYLMAKLGWIRPIYRLPLCEPTGEVKAILDRIAIEGLSDCLE